MLCLPMPVRSCRDLIAWQKAIDLVTEIYHCTQTFPRNETNGLISQLRRAAVSIPSNIAEGHARLTTGEFRQFLGHSLGSLMEIETQIEISRRLEYLAPAESERLLRQTTEVGKVIRGLLKSLKQGLEARD